MLLSLAASHAELPLGRLADLSAATADFGAALAEANAAHDGVPLDGWVVLSTCNRVEIHVDATLFHDGLDVVVEALEQATGWRRPELTTSFQVRAGRPAAEHLFRVASGLESIVLGEAEITGQVRAAFNDALHEGSTTPMLNELFQHSLRTAKRVSSATSLGRAGRSSAEVVLDTAAAALGGGSGASTLAGRRVLVIGSGAYSRVVCAELALRRVNEVGVFSPSGRRSASIDAYGYEHVTAETVDEWMRAADVIVTCSGQGVATVTVESLAGREGAVRPLVVMDAALQSDVADGVAELAGVQVLGLNSLAVGLSGVGDEALAEAEVVVGDGVDRFENRRRERRADPVIVRMRQYLRGIVDEEMASLRTRLPEETVAEVERSVRRVYRKVLHTPTVNAHRHAQAGQTDEYLRALHMVMGIDMDNREATAVIDTEKLPLDAVFSAVQQAETGSEAEVS
ncbi:glutamyl-tRNA reductase [Propionibacteriaceae bacterium G57]|uniref:glutamyl-tRNA reductase n=1 Tax=Aestuariimicrobium sp. G57 TaxID=3418485 RepID=UPI003DA76389